MNNKTIFSQNQIDRLIEELDCEELGQIERSKEKVSLWNKGIEEQTILKYKEETLKPKFMKNFFEYILGYKDVSFSEEFNLIFERKTSIDATKPDGSLGFFNGKEFENVRAIVELKGPEVDLDKNQNRKGYNGTPIDQAFGYASKYDNCRWIIVSNMIEVRLYRNGNRTRFERFLIPEMCNNEHQLKRFYLLLHKDNLINKDDDSVIDKLLKEKRSDEIDISNVFYQEYKTLRMNLFKSIRENNSIDDLIALEKTQKLMDRFIFIWFCINTGLLKSELLHEALNTDNSIFLKIENQVWIQMKVFFSYIDQGSRENGINQFNGGLFKEDKILDDLVIPDDILKEFIIFEKYNYKSDIDVNILGHIFEQSITDLEEIKKSIEDKTVTKYIDKVSKKKLDGIFYTPNYITKYIVKNTIDLWLEERKKEIKSETIKEINENRKKQKKKIIEEIEDIPEKTEYDEKPKTSTEKGIRTRKENIRKEIIFQHKLFWEKYKKTLSNIKIIDYSCGSGAFLNAAFDYLLHEGTIVNQILNKLEEDLGNVIVGQLHGLDLDKEILKNNLYGVDLNKESVEITKLSLWLKTANKYDKLTSLDSNIICGNSLIDSKYIAGDKAFKWEESFKEIFGNGGFDIVIGNPPYGAKLNNDEKKYLDVRYKTTQYNYDTYKFFIELAFNITKKGAYIGLITPNTYFVLEKSDLIRKFLFDNYSLVELVEVFDVFPDAIVEPIISIYKKSFPKDLEQFKVTLIPRKSKLDDNFISYGISNYFVQGDLKKKEKYLFNYHDTKLKRDLCKKIDKISEPLSKYMNVSAGVKPYEVGKGTPKQTKETVKSKPYTSYKKLDSTWYDHIKGGNIQRYTIKLDGEYIKYGEWLAAPRNLSMFSNPKLFIRQTSDKLIATYDNTGKIGKNTVHCIYKKDEYGYIDLKYILGLINSKLLNWIFQYENFHIVGKPLAETKVAYVKRLPIVIDKNQYEVVNIVDGLLDFHQNFYDNAKEFLDYINIMYKPKKISDKLKKFYEIGFEEFIKELKKQKVKLDDISKFELMKLYNNQKVKLDEIKMGIDKLEIKMNRLVYELYKLTEDDIKIVENQ